MGGLPWDADALQRQLQPLWPGLAVEVVAETGSTNADLLGRLRDAALSRPGGSGSHPALRPCLRVAEQQTAGRGRHGRPWHSARGDSLTFSLAVPLQARDWSGLSLAVGVALADAIEPTPGKAPMVGLKWPNDLWLLDAPGRGRKLGGVLIEAVSAAHDRAPPTPVIGVGLNIRPWPAAVGMASGYACIQELDPTAAAATLLGPLAAALLAAMRRFEAEGFAAFRAGFARRDLLQGHAVLTGDPRLAAGPPIAACAEGVTAAGNLRVRDADGSCREVASGEVTVRLADAAEAATTGDGTTTAATGPATSSGANAMPPGRRARPC